VPNWTENAKTARMPQVSARAAKYGHLAWAWARSAARDRDTCAEGVDAGPFAEGGVQVFELIAVRAAVTEDDPPGLGGEDRQDRAVDA
jgi:hypothetical protein